MVKRHYKFVDGELVEYKRKPPHPVDVGIEYDEDLIDDHGMNHLLNRAACLVKEIPDPNFYAKSWLEMSFSDSKNPLGKMPSQEDLIKLISRLPRNLQEALDERESSQLLQFRLFQTINLIQPLIFLETGIKIDKNGTGFKTIEKVSDKYQLYTLLKKDITLYKRKLSKLKLIDHLNRYIEVLNYCSMSQNKGDLSISRAQYAFLVMVLAGLPVEIRRIAEYYSLLKVTGIKNGKVTKGSIHTLSCIIYGLLIEHKNIKRRHKNQKAYCRGLTAEIINAISPKNETGEPCHEIDERGVEYALSGK